jgi:hypothetical protein
MGTLRMGLDTCSKGVQVHLVSDSGVEDLQLRQPDISNNFEQNTDANDCGFEDSQSTEQNNMPDIINNVEQDESADEPQHLQSIQQEVQPSETAPVQGSVNTDLTEGALLIPAEDELGSDTNNVERSDTASNIQHLSQQEPDPDFSNTSDSQHLQPARHELQELEASHVEDNAATDLTEGDDNAHVEQQEIYPQEDQTKESTKQHSAEIDLTGEDDTDTIQSDQQMLLLLQHSSKCKAEDGKCSEFAQCLETKALWKHMPECRTTYCVVSNCLRSRNVLRHYLNCKSSAECEICGALKK